MINRVARGMTRLQRGPLNTENLPVVDILLPILRLVLVDGNLRTETLQIRNPADVVPMPVGEKRLLHCGVFCRKHGLKACCPGGFAFACVDEDPLTPSADQVCVCSWGGLSGLISAVHMFSKQTL